MGKNYESLDVLQKTLSDSVFHYANDRKKAAGRALGTLIEIITYYTLHTWKLSDHIVIEKKIPEFANSDIWHNVEFSLHSVLSRSGLNLSLSLPVTSSKIAKHYGKPDRVSKNQVLSRNLTKRNASVLGETENEILVANLNNFDGAKSSIKICHLSSDPFAIFECKRVGVEEGMKKGPQTIEKAKQGAYVARSVSSLQKVRLRDGSFHGIIEDENGRLHYGSYSSMMRKIIDSPSGFPGFILTIGIVSNHGNWFTSDNPNKELLVLAQSYDWLLFLEDNGLAKFIDDLLLNPSSEFYAARETFMASYGKNIKNRFTKVSMDINADRALKKYFSRYQKKIDKWFKIISPKEGDLSLLRSDLNTLAGRKYQ